MVEQAAQIRRRQARVRRGRHAGRNGVPPGGQAFTQGQENVEGLGDGRDTGGHNDRTGPCREPKARDTHSLFAQRLTRPHQPFDAGHLIVDQRAEQLFAVLIVLDLVDGRRSAV